MRVLSRQYRRSRRTASSGVVKLRESHTARRQRVQDRSVDLASIATEIAETKIIRQYVEDVWLLCRVNHSRHAEKDHTNGREDTLHGCLPIGKRRLDLPGRHPKPR